MADGKIDLLKRTERLILVCEDVKSIPKDQIIQGTYTAQFVAAVNTAQTAIQAVHDAVLSAHNASPKTGNS